MLTQLIGEFFWHPRGAFGLYRSQMNVDLNFLFISLVNLFITGLLSSVFASLRYTGDVGLPRLIERADIGRKIKLLQVWQNCWNLLCKTTRLLLTLSTIATFVFYYRAFADCGFWVLFCAMFVFSLVYMIFARIFPHVLSESYADRISLWALPLVGPLTCFLYIFVWPMQRFEDHLLSKAMQASDDEDRPTTEEEVISLIEDTDEQDLEKEEREIIRSVFDFGESIAREIMTPRIEISGIRDTLSVKECIELVNKSRYSRFPVFHENIDDVIGMIHVKDLLRSAFNGDLDLPINQLVKRIDFVPETMPLNDLLQLMKNSRSQLVLVVDEYGGTEGLVTMEDVIEELVGEIEDEYDLDEKDYSVRSDGTVIVKARMPIYELNETLDAKLPESEEYDSLGGYVYSRLGRIPKPGESLQAPGYTLRVHAATHRQIQIIHMIPTNEASS